MSPVIAERKDIGHAAVFKTVAGLCAVAAEAVSDPRRKGNPMMNLLAAAPADIAADVAEAGIVSADHHVRGEAGWLFLRNKRAARPSAPEPRPTLLMVHGSSYPAEAAFDVALNGVSLMDVLAAQGLDIWIVDIRGYGASERPAVMEGPPDQGAPVARTSEAVADVAAAARHILDIRGRASLALLGWSWGTTLMGAFAAAHPDRVDRLVQLAPQWLRQTPSLSDPGGPIGAYRWVDIAQAKERWLNGVPADQRDALIPADWFEAWAAAILASDPRSGTRHPPAIRAPNGTVADSRAFWAAGRPVYEPADIRCPVLVVHGEWDRDLPLDMARAYFARLTGAPYRRWVEIAEGTHSLLLEKNRMQLIAAVAAFLIETYRPET